MSDLITCPLADGIARRCTPLWMPPQQLEPNLLRPNEPPRWSTGGPLVIDKTDGDGNLHATGWGWLNSSDLHRLQVDLTDATGRAHAVWWLAYQFNMDAFCVAPTLWHREQSWGHDWILEAGEHEMAFGLEASLDDLRDAIGPEDWTDDPAITGLMVVPALADLDPTDDTRLPDGSRKVDALAIKTIVEHLLNQRGAK